MSYKKQVVPSLSDVTSTAPQETLAGLSMVVVNETLVSNDDAQTSVLSVLDVARLVSSAAWLCSVALYCEPSRALALELVAIVTASYPETERMTELLRALSLRLDSWLKSLTDEVKQRMVAAMGRTLKREGIV